MGSHDGRQSLTCACLSKGLRSQLSQAMADVRDKHMLEEAYQRQVEKAQVRWLCSACVRCVSVTKVMFSGLGR